MSDSIKPENIARVRYAVFGLLHNLNHCEADPISLIEQATALEQLSQDLRASAARGIDPSVNHWAKNMVL